jgi:exodeoxyribonuclease VIII
METTPKIQTPGFYPDVPRADYDAIEAINFSTIKHAARSLAHYRHSLDNPTSQTPAMALGQAVHLAVFEPAEFRGSVIVEPDVDGRTKEGKAARAAFAAASAGKTVIQHDDVHTINSMASAIQAHGTAATLLALPRRNEATAVWTDPATGLLCKARMDAWIDDGIVCDLKTTQDARPSAFSRTIAQYQYHLQAAIYLEAIRRTLGIEASFVWIAVESSAPHGVAVYEAAPDTLGEGEHIRAQLMAAVASARKTGKYPGYQDNVIEIGIPAWAMTSGGLSMVGGEA